ncbi:unnamed protein product [Lactuca virosa]|uniref:Telomerase reverse transcriptase n=1 Tax=Lactuca virosa TaxID=75947 RepID=A0AAU9LT93_9ASTR|nr:unnamed protein product [Lactuca virosa]
MNVCINSKCQISPSYQIDTLCDFKFGESRGIVLERWMYWFFTHLIVPLIQANFYVTESEHGKLDVFYYEKSVGENLMKSSVSILKDKCYTLLDVNDVKKIISKRRFGFSRVRFRPKQNGMMRPLANLKSSSTLPNTNRNWTAVNVVLRDLHAALKDLQLEKAEKLGSSVFSYNDVHRKWREFLTGVKSGLGGDGGGVYMVVADVQKAYDSIDQDKLVDVMKDVITDDHLLHHTQNISISTNRKLQISKYINSSTQFRSYPSSHTHSILVDTGRKRKARKDELLFNLQQHVKYNVLKIDKNFYLQNSDKVGMSDGGHSCQKLLMRFIDDFLFISTSKKHAVAFLSRLGRGFREYNCEMNKEKFGVSFDCDMIIAESNSKSNRVYFDEDGNKKFLKWSGLLINCDTLEVQADYTRYLDGDISSSLTVSWKGSPVVNLRENLCNYLRPKCHAIFYDSKINSEGVVRLNIYQAFLICGMKFHAYVSHVSHMCELDAGSYMNIIRNSLRFMYKLMKKQMYSGCVVSDESLRPILRVKKREVEWLGLRAYYEVLKRKTGSYKDVLFLLKTSLDDHGEMVSLSPALKFATHKSNSSLLWKIKY